MDNKKLHFLAKTADILVKELDSYDLVNELKNILKSYIELENLNIYVILYNKGIGCCYNLICCNTSV